MEVITGALIQEKARRLVLHSKTCQRKIELKPVSYPRSKKQERKVTNLTKIDIKILDVNLPQTF